MIGMRERKGRNILIVTSIIIILISSINIYIVHLLEQVLKTSNLFISILKTLFIIQLFYKVFKGSIGSRWVLASLLILNGMSGMFTGLILIFSYPLMCIFMIVSGSIYFGGGILLFASKNIKEYVKLREVVYSKRYLKKYWINPY